MNLPTYNDLRRELCASLKIISKQRAEIERLRAEIEQLRAENERLREVECRHWSHMATCWQAKAAGVDTSKSSIFKKAKKPQ